jgi:hypothetical protein
MSTNNQYYLHGILLPSGVWINQLTDTTPAQNVEKIVEYAAGAVVPSFRGAHGARPDVTFTSTQLGAILAATGMYGVPYAATNVDLFYRQGSNLGTRTAIGTTAHLRVRAVRSVLYWDRISAKQGQLATISCRIVPTFDGTNPPLVATGSVAIAAQPLAAAPYTLGPVKLNGTMLDAISGWDLALNPKINEKASGGDLWSSFCGIERHEPVLTITPEDIGNLATISHTGLQLTALVAYLRRKSTDLVANEPNGSPLHISFAAEDNPCGIASIVNSSGGINEPASMSIECGLRVSNAATTHPLTLSVASTIA